MKILPDSLDRITQQFSKFPGIGRKTAQRMAFQLIEWDRDAVKQLGDVIIQSTEKLSQCSVCNLITEADPCPVCRDTRRDDALLCIVEDSKDVVALEETSRFNGKYHILGGVLSPLEGVGPDQLNIKNLMERLNDTEEVIIAMNPSVEGETTSLYLARLLQDRNIRITRLARGIPSGGDLEYIDGVTLGRALDERHEMK
ncbi:MAG: recombination mediator RecR [Candidatus Marinimicrobia bacterium]|nr:recombination mediator RecR [Candidatus Neomarinimicrobiota bacterium]MCF7850985.1 recombination mediator RecR [Candidatus Neomarinimicrobiota bacterium]MCF7905542.1 recombination mediator RecR [Candidatus Neomarinimicrobiota bacterium]